MQSSERARRGPESSLATKIILLVFVSTFMSAATVSWISIEEVRRQLWRQIDQDYPAVLQRGEQQVMRWLAEGRRATTELAAPDGRPDALLGPARRAGTSGGPPERPDALRAAGRAAIARPLPRARGLRPAGRRRHAAALGRVVRASRRRRSARRWRSFPLRSRRADPPRRGCPARDHRAHRRRQGSSCRVSGRALPPGRRARSARERASRRDDADPSARPRRPRPGARRPPGRPASGAAATLGGLSFDEVRQYVDCLDEQGDRERPLHRCAGLQPRRRIVATTTTSLRWWPCSSACSSSTWAW